MTKVVEAIFEDGVLTPLEQLDLREKQRVRLTVEPIDKIAESDREAALAEFEEGVRKMNFRSTGPYPRRDELHDRS